MGFAVQHDFARRDDTARAVLSDSSRPRFRSLFSGTFPSRHPGAGARRTLVRRRPLASFPSYLPRFIVYPLNVR